MQNDAGYLTRALDRLGVAQTVITAYRPGAPRRDRIGSQCEVLRLGFATRRLRQFYSVPATWRLPARARGADLVHVHVAEDLAAIPLAWIAARVNRLPLIITIHTSLTNSLVVTGARSAVLKTLGGWIERRGARHATAVIVLRPRTGELLVERGVAADRVHVIPQGVDVARFTQPEPILCDVPRPRVVFVGRLSAQKDAATLVAAARFLPSQARVVIVGDGPQRAQLESLAGRLGVVNRVLFRGFVPPEQVPAILTAADVFVLPSRYEELPSVLLEAMAAGTPIVASSVGGVPELISNRVTGLLVPPGNPPALAAAVTEVLATPGLGHRLGQSARAAAGNHSAHTAAEQVLSLYGRVVSRLAPNTDAAPER